MPLVPATWGPGAMFPDAHWAPTDCLQPKIQLTAISHHTWITTGIQMALSQVTLVPQLSISQRIDKASFYMFLLCGYPQRSTIVVSSHFGCHPSREMLHQLAHTFFFGADHFGPSLTRWPTWRHGGVRLGGTAHTMLPEAGTLSSGLLKADVSENKACLQEKW